MTSKRKKLFVASIIIGTILVFVIPNSGCDTVGPTMCQISPIIGYIAYGVAGLIILIQILKLIRELCACCCEHFLSSFRGHRRYSEPLIRDSIRFYQNNQAIQEEQPYQPELWQSYIPDEPLPDNNESFQNVRQTFNQKQCTICLDQFKQEDQIDRKRCGHKFHSACIRDWLQKNDNCPICRIKIR